MAPWLYYSILCVVLILSLKFLFERKRAKNLPPCPPTLPVFGNLQYVKLPLHRSLLSLSQKYGPIFSLWFGSRYSVVITSPKLVQECFTKYDAVLANRPCYFLTGKYIFYNYTSLSFSPYGDHWRNLRRIITIDVLSTPRLNSFYEIRKEETMRLLQNLVRDTSNGFTQVQLRPRIMGSSFNSMMRMLSGKRYYGDDINAADKEEAKEFRDMMTEVLSLLGANNKGDFLPFLRWFDFDGLEKRLKSISVRANAFLERLLAEHRSGKHKANTMIEHLLNMQKTQPEYYTDQIIKGLIQGMLLAGTDTTSVAMEWAISSMLNNPEILKKAKDEIDCIVGEDRLVDESDIPNLPYLQNIMNETLRLYPSAPLLLPHYSSEECTIGGYTIPRDTMVLVNAWAIQRDPKHWNDAMIFRPERFEQQEEANKFIPFGMGRRICPGIGLAHRSMGSTLGLMIQCFEWKRPSDELIDLSEDSGATLPKLIPLEALVKPRPISHKIMQQLVT